MFPISNYLKDWYNTTRSIVMHPRSFFREMPVSGSLREPIEYMLVTTFIASLLTIPMFLIIMADGMETSLTGAILISIGVVVFLLITIGISLPINALVYHLLLKISGAKGDLEATVRVYCYYMAAGIVILPAFGIMMLLSYIVDKNGVEGFISDIIPVVFLLFLTVFTIYFSFYVLTVGFSEVHRISMKRVFLGVFGIPIAVAMILVAIPMLFIFTSGFSTEVSDYSEESTFEYYDEYGNTGEAEFKHIDTELMETINASLGEEGERYAKAVSKMDISLIKTKFLVDDLQDVNLTKLAAVTDEDKLCTLLSTAGDDGVTFVNSIDENSLNKLFSISSSKLDSKLMNEMSANLAKLYESGTPIDEIESFIDNVDKLKNVNGIDKLASRTTGDSGNFKGVAFEAEFAASGNIGDIVEMGMKSPVRGQLGNIDIIQMEGNLKTGYELKNIDFSTWSYFKEQIGDTNRGFEDLVAEGTIDDYKIVFRNEPPQSEIDWLNSNGIPWNYFVE